MCCIAKCSDFPQQGEKGMVLVSGTKASLGGGLNREHSGRHTGLTCVHCPKERRSRERKPAFREGKRKHGNVGHKLAMWRKNI